MTGRIGYLLPTFPVLSETFVANEVRRLAALGVPIRPISLSRSRAAAPSMREELEAAGIDVLYLLDQFPWRILSIALPFAARHPARALWAARENWRLPVRGNVSRLSRWLKILACAKLVQRERLAHLHAHWTLPTDVAMITSGITGVSFSFSAHAHDIYEDGPIYDAQRPGSGLRQRIARAVFVVTCTRRGLEHLRGQSPDAPRKVHLVYHGVDLGLFNVADARPDNGPPLLLAVGRLVAYKGFDVFVEACAQLAHEGIDFRAAIIGDGSQWRLLESMIEHKGLHDRVELLGAQPHEVVRRWLSRADIFVFSGNPALGQYGLPNVLLEALASGVTVVSTRFPELSEAVTDGHDGIIVDSPDALPAVLQELILDETRRESLASNGRSTVASRFDAGRTIITLAGLLRASALPTRNQSD